jgi:hypothetical protein
MIVVFPMLTSRSVSQNVIPGLCKALEKFSIVYGMDKILRYANSTVSQAVGGVITIGTGGILRIKEGDESIVEQGGKAGRGGQNQPTINITNVIEPPKEKEKEKDPRYWPDKGVSKGASQKVEIHNPSYEALSIEPTWIQIQTGKAGLKVLGVKVLPFFVDAPQGIISAMLKDSALSYNEYITQKYKRTAIRTLWRIARTFLIGGDRVITGDPTTDILWATTQYKHNIFTCFNQMELEAPGILESPAAVKKLFSLGWTSFIVADDVNRKATYCMEEFGGVCSTVPYNFLYSSLGSEHSKVFQSLEDVRKSAGPFFRMSTTKNKIFGECLAKNKETKYLVQNLQEWSLVDKVKDLKKSFLVDLFKRLHSAILSNDPIAISSKLSAVVPDISFSTVESTCKRLTPAFERNYELAKTTLRKSTDIVGNKLNYISCLLAIGSTLDTDDPDKKTRENLAAFVNNRKAKAEIDWKELQGKDVKEGIKDALDALATIFGKIREFGTKAILGTIAAIISSIATMPLSLTIGICIIICILIIIYISRDN